MIDGGKLAQVWPEVSRRAETALRRRGVPSSAAQDAVMEAATRAIARSIPFENAEDLLPWIQTVAWRVVIDVRKRDQRLVYELADRPSEENPAASAMAHMQLQHLHSLVWALPAADRDALNVGSPQAVRRHRVRARLQVLLESA